MALVVLLPSRQNMRGRPPSSVCPFRTFCLSMFRFTSIVSMFCRTALKGLTSTEPLVVSLPTWWQTVTLPEGRKVRLVGRVLTDGRRAEGFLVKSKADSVSGTFIYVSQGTAVSGRYVGTCSNTLRGVIVVPPCKTLISDTVDTTKPCTVETHRNTRRTGLLAFSTATAKPSLVAPL